MPRKSCVHALANGGEGDLKVRVRVGTCGCDGFAWFKVNAKIGCNETAWHAGAFWGLCPPATRGVRLQTTHNQAPARYLHACFHNHTLKKANSGATSMTLFSPTKKGSPGHNPHMSHQNQNSKHHCRLCCRGHDATTHTLGLPIVRRTAFVPVYALLGTRIADINHKVCTCHRTSLPARTNLPRPRVRSQWT